MAAVLPVTMKERKPPMERTKPAKHNKKYMKLTIEIQYSKREKNNNNKHQLVPVQANR